ncbi:UNVERIFIED_CONTAM: hypothetical protein HDU68_007122 [Siphonaria sp. JEL0065]|nr:hypothetical protein HDU68_007122 [Siphonaria sp. JEL0065]
MATLDRVIEAIKSNRVKKPKKDIVHVPESDLIEIIETAMHSFAAEPMLLKLTAPFYVISDVHGQLFDLLRHFKNNGYPPSSRYLILGDIVDRGDHSIESIILLFALKLRYPDKVYITRVQPLERNSQQSVWLLRRMHKKVQCEALETIHRLFQLRRYRLKSMESFWRAMAGYRDLQKLSQIDEIVRPLEIPDTGIMCDILWSDPKKFNIEDDPGSGVFKRWGANDRGTSWVFGENLNITDLN